MAQSSRASVKLEDRINSSLDQVIESDGAKKGRGVGRGVPKGGGRASTKGQWSTAGPDQRLVKGSGKAQRQEFNVKARENVGMVKKLQFVKQRHEPPAWGKTTKGTGKWSGKDNTRLRHLQIPSTGKGKGKASKGFQGQVAGYDGWAEPRRGSGRQGGAFRPRPRLKTQLLKMLWKGARALNIKHMGSRRDTGTLVVRSSSRGKGSTGKRDTWRGLRQLETKGPHSGKAAQDAGRALALARSGSRKGAGKQGKNRSSWTEAGNWDEEYESSDRNHWKRQAERGNEWAKASSKGKRRDGDAEKEANNHRSEHELSLEDRQLMKKITIVAQLDRTPEPSPAMRSFAAGNRSRNFTFERAGSLSSRIGANFGR